MEQSHGETGRTPSNHGQNPQDPKTGSTNRIYRIHRQNPQDPGTEFSGSTDTIHRQDPGRIRGFHRTHQQALGIVGPRSQRLTTNTELDLLGVKGRQRKADLQLQPALRQGLEALGSWSEAGEASRGSLAAHRPGTQFSGGWLSAYRVLRRIRATCAPSPST